MRRRWKRRFVSHFSRTPSRSALPRHSSSWSEWRHATSLSAARRELIPSSCSATTNRSSSVLVDPPLNVVRALAGSELDDAIVGEALLDKGIYRDDSFDVLSAPADGQDDAAVSRYLSPRDEDVAGGIVLLQKRHVRRHVCVNSGEVDLVNQLNDEHGPQLVSNL